MSVTKPILFFRGLSSEGRDSLNLGPLPLPISMSKPWCDLLRREGARVYAVEGLGGGSLASQVKNAENYMKAMAGELKEGFHLMGHSAGGLVAWGVASRHESPEKILSLTTLSTPHQGARLAEIFIELAKSPDLKLKLLKRFGYDSEARSRLFGEYTRESIEKFKSLHPLHPSLKVASCSFSVKPREMTWPVALVYHLGMRIPDRENDGFIERDSQKEGLDLGHYALDHLSQIGYQFYFNPRLKVLKTKLFNEVGRNVLKHLRDVEKSRTSIDP
jgi:pimeloyl-ACP methyl ester carboxylesterase